MKIVLYLLLAAAIAVPLQSCKKGPSPKASHVVFLALDGWATQSFENDLDNMPTVKKLMEEGCYTFRKRSTMPSSSATNWATIFMGVPPEMHGYNAWDSKVPAIEPYAVGKNGMPPTVYTLLAEQRPEAVSACIYNWDGIGYVVDTAAVGFHLYDPGYHDQSDSTYDMLSYTRRQAVRYLEENKPAFFTFYIGDVDLWGHGSGWESEEYRKCLAQTDEAIALVIQTLKDQGMYDDTVIVVTSDHGGMGNGHGGFTLKEMETPFVIAGKNVARKGEIGSFMMQYDVAATLAEALGLRIPSDWRGRSVPVFEK